MPKVYQDLILDPPRQFLPVVEQSLILFQNCRSGHAKIALAERHLLVQPLFHGQTWVGVLGPDSAHQASLFIERSPANSGVGTPGSVRLPCIFGECGGSAMPPRTRACRDPRRACR